MYNIVVLYIEYRRLQAQCANILQNFVYVCCEEQTCYAIRITPNFLTKCFTMPGVILKYKSHKASRVGFEKNYTHVIRQDQKNCLMTIHIWPHQLCKKMVKETIFNIWRNEKYFPVLLIYQLFGYNFGKIKYKNLVYNDFNWILPKQ